MTELLAVFANAAVPQKAVFVVLLASILVAPVSAFLAARRGRWPLRFISELRITGPCLGLLVAAMGAFHMMDTTLRLPASPTAVALAPGVMEIAALVGLGALSGLVATLVCAALGGKTSAEPS